MKICVTTFLSLTLSLSAATFNVRDFGATGDGKAWDTGAIQKALDACANTGGTVEFPAGIYLSRPIVIHTKTTFQLDGGAILQATTNQMDFMKTPGDWLKAKSNDFVPFIRGSDLVDVTFTGGGIIDGGGSVWWGEAENARQIRPGYTLPRPNLVVLMRCKNLVMENITLRNSPKFHFVPTECEGLVISNVTILAPEHAANTDAIDPSNCRKVLITRCRIDVGDDNVAIKAGSKVAGQEFACEDITVTDCTFLHGHGVSIGSETAGGVSGVVVRDCTFENTENGLRIKSQKGKGGVVENIRYEHITMKNVDTAITFTCYYANNSAGDAAGNAAKSEVAISEANKAAEKLPIYRNIQIKDLVASCPRGAGMIAGMPESVITDVTLENVQITAAKSFEIRNAKGIQLKNVTVTVPGGEPFKLENAKVAGLPDKSR